MRSWFIVAALALSGCADQFAALSPQLNEPEQHLIGRPDTQVLECMGSPREKRADGYTSTWLYDYAGGMGGSSQACSLSVTFKGAYVSRVTTADVSGRTLPEGQRCLPVTLEWCARTSPAAPPTPVPGKGH
jgi:hypothetical protein